MAGRLWIRHLRGLVKLVTATFVSAICLTFLLFSGYRDRRPAKMCVWLRHPHWTHSRLNYHSHVTAAINGHVNGYSRCQIQCTRTLVYLFSSKISFKIYIYIYTDFVFTVYLFDLQLHWTNKQKWWKTNDLEWIIQISNEIHLVGGKWTDSHLLCNLSHRW